MNKLLLAITLLVFGSGLSAQENERAFSFHIGSGFEMGTARFSFQRQGGNSHGSIRGYGGGGTEFAVVFKNKVRADLGVRYDGLIPFYKSLFDKPLKNEFSPYLSLYKIIPIKENLDLHLGGCIDWYLHKDQRVGVDEYKNSYQFGGGPLIGLGLKRLRIDFLYIPKFNEKVDFYETIGLVENKFTLKLMYDYLSFPKIRKNKSKKTFSNYNDVDVSSGLSSHESDWNFHSEVGFGACLGTRWVDNYLRYNRMVIEERFVFPAPSLGFHLKYKFVSLDADFYNFMFYPGISAVIFERKKRNKLFVTYHVSNLPFISKLDNKRKSWVYHCAGLKYQSNRISFSALYNVLPVYETYKEEGGVIPGLVLNISYTFLRIPELINLRKYYIQD